MEKIRSSERRQTVDYLPVLDPESGKVIGRAIDFSDEGLKIHANVEMSKGSRMRVKLEIPPEILPAGYIMLDVRSRWSKQVHGHTYFATGFEVINESPEAKRAIEKMVDVFSYVVKTPETLD